MTYRNPPITYNAVDIVKFIMAFCVIAIHTSIVKEPAFCKYSAVIEVFIRMAVPYFFMTSSFFLFLKLKDVDIQEKSERINRYIRKMIRLYVIWTVIHFPIAVYHYISDGVSFIVAVLSILRGFFLFGENYMSWQLWYLLCTIYSMFIMKTLMEREWKDRQILGLAILVFGCSLIIRFLTETVDNYSGVIRYAIRGLELILANGRMLTGMFYLAVGMCIANHPRLLGIPWYFSLMSATLAFLVTVCWENEMTKQILYISVFLFVLSIRIPGKNRFLAFRRASTIMYFVHMTFVFILSLLIGTDGFYLLRFILVTTASLVVSWIVIQIEKKGNKKSISLFE